ncbi:MAG TPA: hypothetical protein VGM39_13345 [Kofleriaceae bacterium]|jgi:hypothetical protein
MTDLPQDIQRLVAGERSAAPNTIDSLSMKVRIAASVAALAVPSTAAAGTGKVLSIKLLALIIGVGAVTGTAFFVVTRTPDVSAPSIVVASAEPLDAQDVHAEQHVAESPVIATRTEMPRVVVPKPRPVAVTAAADDEPDLIFAATRALRRGDADLALATLDEHAKRFPHGELTEERDAIRIETLLALHRDAEAELAAEVFASAHPHSVHQPLIERALKENTP